MSTKRWLRCMILIGVACMKPSDGQQCGTDAQCIDCAASCATIDPNDCNTESIRTFCPVSCGSCPNNNQLCMNLNCAQRCQISADRTSATCGCFDGYQLDQDGRSCNDIDECQQTPDACSSDTSGDVCTNIAGHYTCSNCTSIDPSNIWGYYQRSDCCLRNTTSGCGKSISNTGRIVGGEAARLQQWPWQAFLFINGSFICGGSLITTNHIVTAAHCVVDDGFPSVLQIIALLGSIDINDVSNVHSQTFFARTFTVHPDYNFPFNDVAVIELDGTVIISDYVSPICLPNGEEPAVGEICYATGHGTTSEGGEASDDLLQVDLAIVSTEECQVNQPIVNGNLHICAGFAEGGKDTCQGDSGGPLACQRCNSCDWYLAGVTSFGDGCARPRSYGVYTRVTAFEEWITGITNQAFVQGECVRPSWGQWGEWSSCSVTCGSGMRSRTRECMNGEVNNPGCFGLAEEVMQCNGPLCSGWSEWSEFTDCSATCGGGTQSRNRTCANGSPGDDGCIGGTEETVNCNTQLCVGWTEWGQWSDCSVSCGTGSSVRNRTCMNGNPGDAGCLGDVQESMQCNTQLCVGWTEWGEWSACSASCGTGMSTRNRTCMNGNPGDAGCPGVAEESLQCNTQPCVGWTEWSQWSDCSVSCGTGMTSRSRTCINGNPGDADCPGDAQESMLCNTRLCIGWTDWSPWSDCSVSCGTGMNTRNRTCINGNPGDADCPGDAQESMQCNVNLCPVWSQWSMWSDCSVSCGTGNRSRERMCANGDEGDIGCMGASMETEECNNGICPGMWSEWENVGECNATCEGGVQRQIRECIGGDVGGPGCIGDVERYIACNTQNCIGWTEFGPYGDCSLACGGGIQIRERDCIDGEPGSENCPGEASETRTCNDFLCGGGVCDPFLNVQLTGSCCVYADAGHCNGSALMSYMEKNCALSCCRVTNKLDCNSGINVNFNNPANPANPASCRDGFPICPKFIDACDFDVVSELCPVTCNACPRP